MITAKQIFDWAATGEAQRELPRLIRRLTHGTAITTQITMPAGDSTSLPGFDGELHSEAGNSWIPAGHSCWEVSCRADVSVKANEDYDKRSAAFAGPDMAKKTYVAVTGRSWRGKAKWVGEKRAESKWADVRAYDADDLEQWLEQSPAVAIAFGEELGLVGPGVTSLSSYFRSWATQCSPHIHAAALLSGREQQRDRISKKCRDGLDAIENIPVSIKGDSVEEAVAFVAATLEQDQDLALKAVVVTDANGWRFVEKNTEIRIAIAARPEIADTPPARTGLIIVVPYASGDMAKQFPGIAGRLDDPNTTIDRADHSEFEKALQSIGIDENDSRRLSGLCGRSWSVFRRQHAVNPAIRRPAWLAHQSTAALATLCLIGSWSSSKDADKEAIARVAGKSYNDLERDLLELERLDDSPVVHIGTVWKAKSALELLSLFGDRITDAELDRFFSEAKSILSTPNPELELPETERYAAAIHGKKRPISGMLLAAFCDTLIKLAVRGPDVASLAAKHIDMRVDVLVRGILQDADSTRWLSLAYELPALAEASPDQFLAAIEASLGQPDAPVRSLLEETGSAGAFGGRCWHSGLLWALETLAWAPQRLTRVSLILARLATTEIAGNWVNRPDNSLVDLYRSWFPQTGATVEQRIAAIDVLIAREPLAAAKLLNSLTNIGHDVAHHTARPKWRDDDAGAGYGATGIERHTMLVAAADRQLKLANQDAGQIAALVTKYATFDDERRLSVIALLDGLAERSDDEKETVRAALRSKIHWHRNYDENRQEIDAFLAPLEAAYEQLQPSDPIIRDAYLFKGGWPNLAVRHREDSYEERQRLVEQIRAEALGDIFNREGWSGILRLAAHTGAEWQIGFAVLPAGIDIKDVLLWVVTETGELERGKSLTSLAAGILSALTRQEGRDVVSRLLELAGEHGRPMEWKVRLLILAVEDRATWTLVDSLGPEAHDQYWRNCVGNVWLHDDPPEMEYALKKLVAVGRPVTALNACHIKFEGLDPELVLEMLDGLLRGVEADAALPDSYHIQQAIDYLEASAKIDPMRLAQLEFSLIKALGFDGEHHAASLYRMLMSRPEIFVELISLLYKPKNGPERETTEADKMAATNAWSILHACKRQPGTSDDGAVTEEALAAFIEKARELAREQDRLEVCDIHLGEIMAHAPEGQDGIFPFEPARNVMEATASADILSGFRTGCFNKRGVHSRGMLDGGEQERELASNYNAHAKALEITHPLLSDILAGLGKSYDRDGLMQDLEVQLRREGR